MRRFDTGMKSDLPRKSSCFKVIDVMNFGGAVSLDPLVFHKIV